MLTISKGDRMTGDSDIIETLKAENARLRAIIDRSPNVTQLRSNKNTTLDSPALNSSPVNEFFYKFRGKKVVFARYCKSFTTLREVPGDKAK